jgi:predicted RNase H-like HicB family nuclease
VIETIESYTVFIEPSADGGFIVVVPALPGCVSQGETLEEARAMAGEAVRGYLQAMQDGRAAVTLPRGKPIKGELAAIILQYAGQFVDSTGEPM